MELGERIKQARLAAGLSQRQLCGEKLTRNMLSLIENGAARPSMDTLRYFAQQLNKPLGWFLEEEAVVSPNQQVMDKARACWRVGDGRGVLETLERYKPGDDTFDDEMGLLGYLATLSEAEKALDEGKLPYARHLLARKWESAYIKGVNGDGLLLARAVQESDPGRCLEILQAARDKSSARWLYLAGQAAYKMGDFPRAAEWLTPVEEKYPDVVGLLEVCHRELGDFKLAYEYACKGRK